MLNKYADRIPKKIEEQYGGLTTLKIQIAKNREALSKLKHEIYRQNNEIKKELSPIDQQILELQRQIRELEKEREKRHETLYYEKVHPLHVKETDLKGDTAELIKNYNTLLWIDFINKIDQLLQEGYKIIDLTLYGFYNSTVHHYIGQDMATNFHPEPRRISEIGIEGLSFYYKTENNEGKEITKNKIHSSVGQIYNKAPKKVIIKLSKKFPRGNGNGHGYIPVERDGRTYEIYVNKSQYHCPVCLTPYGEIYDELWGKPITPSLEYPSCSHKDLVQGATETIEVIELTFIPADLHTDDTISKRTETI